MFKWAKKRLPQEIELYTAFITSAVTVYIFSRIYFFWETYRKLEPNAWGDFFAGVFSPLAFMWLIVGYFLQARELRESVAAQNENAQAALALLEHERRKSEAQHKKENTAQLVFGSVGMEPLPIYSDTGEIEAVEYAKVDFQIANLGESAFNYEIVAGVSNQKNYEERIKIYEVTNLSGESNLIWLKHQVNCVEIKIRIYEFPVIITCNVTYTNKDQSEETRQFEITIDNVDPNYINPISTKVR